MDKLYWDEYYKKRKQIAEPSCFAKTIVGFLEKGNCLLELGCGDGRDSIYFAKNGIDVYAVDQSEIAINKIRQFHNDKMHLYALDFVTSNVLDCVTFDYIYSRFTLHSITATEQREVLEKTFNLLNRGGKLFVEARCIEDEIYGKGELAERNAFIYEGHYRRFIVKEELEEEMQNFGFEILQSTQSRGYAKYGAQDPTVLRIIATKL